MGSGHRTVSSRYRVNGCYLEQTSYTCSGPGKVVLLVGLALLAFLGHKFTCFFKFNSFCANEVIAATGA